MLTGVERYASTRKEENNSVFSVVGRLECYRDISVRAHPLTLLQMCYSQNRACSTTRDRYIFTDGSREDDSMLRILWVYAKRNGMTLHMCAMPF